MAGGGGSTGLARGRAGNSVIDPRVAHRLHGRKALSALELGASTEWLQGFFPSLKIHHAHGDPANPVDLPEASVDVVLALDYLERLRMDQLYMVASESRRVLRPGGLWILRALSFPSNPLRRVLSGAVGKFNGDHLRELNHYISPEDWNTLEDFRQNEGLLTRQTLVLERR